MGERNAMQDVGVRQLRSRTSATAIVGGLAAVAMALPAAATAQEAIALDQIVVTAGGFEQALKDAPASVSVIQAEELERGAFTNLADALREVQGVSVTGVANERDIFIRGLPGAYTLILVDGRRQSTRDARPNGNSGYEQSFIPPLSAIDRIEVVRGPMSSLYGSDAMGGVINIITKRADQEWRGSVTAEVTAQEHDDSGHSGQLSFHIGGPLVRDRLSLQLWGRVLDRSEDRILAGNQGREESDLAARLTYALTPEHDLWFEAGRTVVRGITSAGRVLAPTAEDAYRDYSRESVAVGHSGRWGDARTELSLQVEEGQRETYEREAGGAFVRDDRVPRIRNTVLDGKLTLPFSMGGDHTLVTGFQHQNARLTDRGSREEDQRLSVDQWALFAEDEWWLSDRFAVTAGVRYNHHETYGSHVTPRLYAVFHATEALTLKGGYSTGFRAPEIRQVAPGYYLPTQRGAGLLAPNPDLEPETSDSLELAALWDNGRGLSLGGTLFHTRFRDKISNFNTGRLIDPDTGSIIDPLGGAACDAAALEPFPGYSCLWQNFNIDDAVIKGVELTADWEATESLSFRASYTHTSSEQRTGDFAGYPLARTPRHQASLRLDWVTPIEGLEAWTAANYHGSELAAGPRIGTNGAPVVINGVEGRKYAAYATVDVGASYQVSDRVSLSSAIYNITDKRTDEADYNSVGEGRRLWLGLTTRF